MKRPHRGVKLLTTSAGQNEHFQIGFVERYNQTICRATTVNIVAAQKQYGSTYKQKHWGYAMEYALIMRTYFPLKKYNYEATPYELLTGEKPDFRKLTILPFWQRAIGVQNRQLVRNGAGTKLQPAGIELHFISPVEGGKLVGKFYNPATQQTSVKRSYVPFSIEGVEEYLVHNIDDEDESIEQAIEDGGTMDESDVVNEYTSEEEDKADYLADDEIEVNTALLKYRVLCERDAPKRLRKSYKRVDSHMLEKDEHGKFIALWIIDAIVVSTSGSTDPYYRYYNAFEARPADEDSFEYTLIKETEKSKC